MDLQVNVALNELEIIYKLLHKTTNQANKSGVAR